MGSVDVPSQLFEKIVHKIRAMGSINKY